MRNGHQVCTGFVHQANIGFSISRYELEDLEMKPDQEPLLVEQIHAAAFKHNTLGLPKICPEENVGKISRQTLYTYLKAFHRQF